MLASVIIRYFLLDGVSYAGPVNVLANNCLSYMHSCMKEMLMVPMQYVTLENLRNNSLIVTKYKVNIFINSFKKKKLYGTYHIYIYSLGSVLSIDII